MVMKKCSNCGVFLVDGAKYCHMCGEDIMKAELEQVQKQRDGDIPMYVSTFQTASGNKTIEVWCHDISSFPQDLDLLTVSAFSHSYYPVERTVLGALYQHNGIDIQDYAQSPYMDLRESVECWISRAVKKTERNPHIYRIGCIEFAGSLTPEEELIANIKGYCHALDLAADAGISLNTVGMPVVGTGRQKIDSTKVIIPLINEVVSLLKRNSGIQKLLFIEKNYEKAKILAETLRISYQMASEERFSKCSRQSQEPLVFISYTTHGDTNTAKLVRNILKENGVACWMAPESVHPGDYSSQIVEAIEKCTHFICIVSQQSMESTHVLNELDLAVQHLADGLKILPFLVEDTSMTPSFKYYLSRMQWNYGCPPPLEDKARGLVEKILSNG